MNGLHDISRTRRGRGVRSRVSSSPLGSAPPSGQSLVTERDVAATTSSEPLRTNAEEPSVNDPWIVRRPYTITKHTKKVESKGRRAP
jgi:hypothetical protein